MARVQSSWFPLTDRNPQVPTDIPNTAPEQFKSAPEQAFHWSCQSRDAGVTIERTTGHSKVPKRRGSNLASPLRLRRKSEIPQDDGQERFSYRWIHRVVPFKQSIDLPPFGLSYSLFIGIGNWRGRTSTPEPWHLPAIWTPGNRQYVIQPWQLLLAVHCSQAFF